MTRHEPAASAWPRRKRSIAPHDAFFPGSLGQQPGQPEPPGNPPRDPEAPPPVREPPPPIPIPPADVPPPPQKAARRSNAGCGRRGGHLGDHRLQAPGADVTRVARALYLGMASTANTRICEALIGFLMFLISMLLFARIAEQVIGNDPEFRPVWQQSRDSGQGRSLLAMWPDSALCGAVV